MGPDKILLEYDSKRKLYDFAEGLLMGLGTFYGVRIDIFREVKTVNNKERCTFEITFSQESL